MRQIEQLEKTIEMLEAQREALGDAVIDAAQAPLKQKLASLRHQEAVGEQRKIVSILFADVEGFTAMSEQMDPEDVHEVLQAYFGRWTTCIEHYGGVVEKFIGDAVMAVFGLHTAREDDSERAVRAALEMRDAMGELNQQLADEWGLNLTMRVGINTGQVVVGLLGERRGQDFVVVGDTVNLASRLQTHAPPNGVLISHDTFRLVRGSFDIQALEPMRVKGKRDPVRAYLVVQPKSRSLRFDRTSTETPLVGREKELANLEEALRSVLEQQRQQTVLVMGDAGMGKSRLIDEFEYRLELLPEVVRYFKGRASPYLQQQPYALLRDLFSYRFGIQDGDAPQEIRRKMEHGLGDPQAVEYIARLLAVPLDHPSTQETIIPDGADARLIYDRALMHLARFFLNASAANPVVVVMEDLQWADDSSLEIAAALRRELAHSRVLWVASARPELSARVSEETGEPGIERDFDRQIELHPLTPEASLALTEALLAQNGPMAENVPDELRKLVVGSAEGNPFYVEELLRMLVEDEVIVAVEGRWQVQAERLEKVSIPPTLAEFLQSRLDSLPADERAVLQRAAVVGRVFWDQALDVLSAPPGVRPIPQPARPVDELLSQMRSSDIILQRDQSQFEGTREYLFTHTMFRDVTYESLLKRQRRVFHAHAARWLEQVTERSSRTDEYAAVIAEHYALAEENEPAALWHRRTGELASARFANAEAIHNFTRALELTPASDLETRYSLLLAREEIYNRLGRRPAQESALRELMALAEKLDDDHRRAEAHVRQANLHFYNNDYPPAIECAQTAAALAEKIGEQRFAAEAQLLWGRVLLWQSENSAAIEHLELGIRLAREADLPDVEANCLWNLGVVVYNLSDFARSQELLQEALGIFRQTGDRTGEGLTVAQIGNIHYSLGDYDQAVTYWESAREVFHWTGQMIREAAVTSNLGSIAHARGNYGEAERLQTQALAIYDEANDQNGRAVTLSNLGSLAREMGQFEQAREMFEQSVQIAREVKDRYIETPAHGDLCLLYIMMGDYEPAIASGEEAVRLARKIQAQYYEGYGLLRLGMAYLLAGRLEKAQAAFEQSLVILEELGLDVSVLEARAGLARIAAVEGRLDDTRALIEPVAGGLDEEKLHLSDDPGHLYLNLYQVLSFIGDPRAAEIARQAREWLLTRAGHIEDPETRRSYLENVPLHRALADLPG